MRVRWMLGPLALASIVAALVVAGVAAAGPAAECATPGAQPPSPGSLDNELLGVAATSRCNAWAVGYFQSTSGVFTLAERWDGRAWAVQPSPNPGGDDYLDAVAALSSSDA